MAERFEEAPRRGFVETTGLRAQLVLVLMYCLATPLLTGCQPSQKERKQIGGKGKEIQLTWEEEQSRGSQRTMDIDGNPPPLLDCEERAWKNMRALGISTPDRFRIDAEGDSFVQVGQYAFRKPKGYGGKGNNPAGGNAQYFATLPDFSPMYQVNHALCDDTKALRDSSGNVIDGSTCRRYDVVAGVASLASISLQCIDKGHLAAGYGSNVQQFPDLYWPREFIIKPERVMYSAYDSGNYEIAEAAWRTLTPSPRLDLGLMEWKSGPDQSIWPASLKDLQGGTFYTPLSDPLSWHLNQPIVFVCSIPFDRRTADTDQKSCQGPAYLGASFVAPGLTATMSFPIKFLPQWRDLTSRFTNFVTTYQTSDPAAPPAALPAPSLIPTR